MSGLISDYMKKLVLISALLFTSLYSTQCMAQAYDGKGDNKIFLGYTNIKGCSGAEWRLDSGMGDLFSMGFNATYLFIKIEPVSEDEGSDKFDKIFKNIDLGFLLNFHLSVPLNMNEKIDPYFGLVLNLKSAGLHAGVKYNFTERFGVYMQLTDSFIFAITGKSISWNESHFGKYIGVSGGITYNLMR